MSALHHTLCLHGLHWAVRQRWATSASVEVTLRRPRWWWLEYVESSEAKRRPPVQAPRADVAAVGDDRIALIEAKVTRGDLLADLRAGKMMRHYGWATHCYLLLGGEVVDTPLAELAALGLPGTWGVLRCGEAEPPEVVSPYHLVRSVRTARRLRELRPDDAGAVQRAIGRSAAWRILRAAVAELEAHHG